MKPLPLDPPDIGGEPMAVTDLEGRVTELIAEKLQLEVPSPGVDLFETGLLDSLRFVELLASLEEAFGVTVSVEEIELDDFRTTARIAEFILRKRAPPQG